MLGEALTETDCTLLLLCRLWKNSIPHSWGRKEKLVSTKLSWTSLLFSLTGIKNVTVLCVKCGITQGGRESCIYYQGDFIFLGVGKASPLGSRYQDHLIGGTSTYVLSSSTKPDTIATSSISPPFSIHNFVIKEGATSEHFRFYAHPDRNCLFLCCCLCVCIYHVSHSHSVFFAAILLVIIYLDFLFPIFTKCFSVAWWSYPPCSDFTERHCGLHLNTSCL